VVLLAAVVLAGCTGRSASRPAQTPLRHVTCPADVNSNLVIAHACYQLQVALDAAHPNGPKGQIFILKMEPPKAADTPADPMLMVEAEIGDNPQYGGYAPMAQRVHRVVWVMDPRGSGHSTPSLGCPEAAHVRSSDKSAVLTEAVDACLARLRNAGIDPRLFDAAGVARDSEALRRALDVREWNVISIGTTSIYSERIAAMYPRAVRTLVMDSPLPAPGASAAAATEAAWAQLATDCLAQAPCASAFPDVRALWRKAAVIVSRKPIIGKRYTVDAAELARLVRSLLAGESPDPLAGLPAMLRSVQHRVMPSEYQDRLETEGSSCLGYRPACDPVAHFSLGTYLSGWCPNVVPVQEQPSPLPGLTALDAANPFNQACQHWPMHSSSTPRSTTVPRLVLTGALDPFAGIQIQTSMADVPHTTVVVVANQTHDVLGYSDCAIGLRNSWIDKPTAPLNLTCLSGLPPVPLGTG
jgi:pimeloyl-ACP methyl ester carboxylesterase